MEMTVWICCVLIVVLLYVLAIHPSCRRAAREAKREVRYYAHRGLYDNNSDAPENSLRAFALAAEAGYGAELDVHLTRDRSEGAAAAGSTGAGGRTGAAADRI